MRNPADNLRLYRFCGYAALVMVLASGAMAAVGSPGMWFPAALGYAEAWGFALIVARSDPSPTPQGQGERKSDG